MKYIKRLYISIFIILGIIILNNIFGIIIKTTTYMNADMIKKYYVILLLNPVINDLLRSMLIIAITLNISFSFTVKNIKRVKFLCISSILLIIIEPIITSLISVNYNSRYINATDIQNIVKYSKIMEFSLEIIWFLIYVCIIVVLIVSRIIVGKLEKNTKLDNDEISVINIS